MNQAENKTTSQGHLTFAHSYVQVNTVEHFIHDLYSYKRRASTIAAVWHQLTCHLSLC